VSKLYQGAGAGAGCGAQYGQQASGAPPSADEVD